jgi:hypothetical protein
MEAVEGICRSWLKAVSWRVVDTPDIVEQEPKCINMHVAV